LTGPQTQEQLLAWTQESCDQQARQAVEQQLWEAPRRPAQTQQEVRMTAQGEIQIQEEDQRKPWKMTTKKTKTTVGRQASQLEEARQHPDLQQTLQQAWPRQIATGRWTDFRHQNDDSVHFHQSCMIQQKKKKKKRKQRSNKTSSKLTLSSMTRDDRETSSCETA
jgi:hypothetical protein